MSQRLMSAPIVRQVVVFDEGGQGAGFAYVDDEGNIKKDVVEVTFHDNVFIV